MGIIIALFLMFGEAFGDYHYASHTGSDEYPYTSWETAADSIGDAVAAASRGDTVYVGPGLYYDAIELKERMGLIGSGMDSCEIDGLYGDWYVILPGPLDSFVVVEGLSLRGKWARTGVNQVGIDVVHHHITVRNNKIYECEQALGGFGEAVIENNVIYNNKYALYMGGEGPPEIRNNTFYGESDLGDYIRLESFDFIFENNVCYTSLYIWMPWRENTRIANNLFFGPPGYWKIIGIDRGNPTIINNTVVGSEGINYAFMFSAYGIDSCQASLINNIQCNSDGYAFRCEGSSDNYGNDGYCHPKLYYNDCWNNAKGLANIYGDAVSLDTIVGNIYVDPMFADTVDFELQMFSPCIDAGDPNITDVDWTRSDMGYLGGPGGRSYEYMDLPPAIPDSFYTAIGVDTIFIGWRYATESDFSHYNIYRSNESGFSPSPDNYYAPADSSEFKDTDWYNDRNYYYRITAVDNQDNESEPSEEVPIVFVGVDGNPPPLPPKALSLYQNYPNPFNPQTTIRYYLPTVGAQPAEVRIVIYDLLGREVKVLLDGKQYPGEHRVVWDGRDKSGSILPSGIYFYRLEYWGRCLTGPKKMILMK